MTGDAIFDLCMAGVAGALFMAGCVVGFAFKHYLIAWRERRAAHRRTADGWEPIGQKLKEGA